MATFKFYLPKEEHSLKLHYTFSNLGDLKEQLYFLWVQLNYVLKGEQITHNRLKVKITMYMYVLILKYPLLYKNY